MKQWFPDQVREDFDSVAWSYIFNSLPEPVDAIGPIKSQGSVSLTNTGRLEFSYLFEVQGEVFWICFE